MINMVGEINKIAKTDPNKLITNAESKYLTEIYTIAKQIAENNDIKIVAIAGPSGSGKTTSAHILCERLYELGEKTEVVSLDDFYLSSEELPILPDGTTDIESVNSLNLNLINKCFAEIIENGKTVLPHYDFENKKCIENYKAIDVSNRGIIIVEGLHALNPIISDLVPRNNIFKIYISANCSIEDDFGEQMLSSRQIRLVRRMLRDRVFRGADANRTLELWNGVVSGERKYLYCYKNTADAFLKTLHVYEPCVYKDDFLALKKEVLCSSVGYDYFIRTANAIEKFETIKKDLVPKNSLIREFIGPKEQI